MNFRRSLPEIRCATIYWTTTIPHHNGSPPDPFQQLHAGFGSCGLLGDVHQVPVRPICTSLLALGPIRFTQAKSLRRRSPRLRVDRRWTIFRVASTDRNQISGLSTSQNGDLLEVIRLWCHVTCHRGLYATRSSPVPRFLGFTTISTSCPSATRKRMRRSTEYPRN